MQKERPTERLVGDDLPDDLAIERPHRPLLLVLLGPRAELLRRDERQQIDVPAADVRIPRRRSSPGDHDDAIWRNGCLREGPRDERDPIEQLESDFTGPRTHEHRPIPVGQAGDSPSEPSLHDAQLLLPLRKPQPVRQHLVLTGGGVAQFDDVPMQSTDIAVEGQEREPL